MRPKIVAILPRGEAIRNFVWTGAFDHLANGAELTILSVVPNERLLEILRRRYSDVLPLWPVKERWLVGFQRDFLDLAHGRWLWSEAARERWRLRDLDARASPAGRVKRAVRRAACLAFANRPGLEFLSAVERTSSRWLRATDEYASLYQRLQPSLVFNGSHVHSRPAIPAVEAARWLGISTAAFIFSWDNLTSQGRIVPPYDYYLVWNEAIRDQLLKIYSSVRPEQVIVTGTPQFDFHVRREFHWSREQFCACVSADPARPIVLYSTGMPNHMPDEPAIVEQIAAIVRGMRDLGPPQLLVRIYAKDLTGRFDELKSRCPDVLFPPVPWEPAWYTPTLDDAYLLTNTLRHAAVGINVASTISLELCMLDKPVINVAYNPKGLDPAVLDYARYYEFDHYREVATSGAVMIARGQAEMHWMLRDAITKPDSQAPARRALTERLFAGNLDGRVAGRLAETLLGLARERPRAEPQSHARQ